MIHTQMADEIQYTFNVSGKDMPSQDMIDSYLSNETNFEFFQLTIKDIYVHPTTRHGVLYISFHKRTEILDMYQSCLDTRDYRAMQEYQLCCQRDCNSIRTSHEVLCDQCILTNIKTPNHILQKQYYSHLNTVAYHKVQAYHTAQIPTFFSYNDITFQAYHYVIECWKYIGETPLMTMRRVQVSMGIPDYVKSCYTGRLDPMAQGITCLLFGQNNVSQMNEYNTSDKVYRFQAILGISTTSYDPLGIITEVNPVSDDAAEKFRSTLINKIGKFQQVFPPMSARKYKGKPLWHHYNEGTIPPDKDMPVMEREIYEITSEQLIETNIGDYRKECISDIRDVIKQCGEETFGGTVFIRSWKKQDPTIKLWKCIFTANVSSGTFIRSLVHNHARELGIAAHAFRITRISLSKLDHTS